MPIRRNEARVGAALFALLASALSMSACVEHGGVIPAADAASLAVDGGRPDAGTTDAGTDGGVDGGGDGGGDGGIDGGIDGGPTAGPDEAGGVDDPLLVTLDVVVPLNLYPAGDVDCFRFAIAELSGLSVHVSAPGESACGVAQDTRLVLMAAGSGDLIAESDDESPASRCPRVEWLVSPGDYVVCVAHYFELEPDPVFGVTLELTRTPPPVCGDLLLGFGEVCDDGNAAGGDGCADDCRTTEPGFFCPPSGAGVCDPVQPSASAESCADPPVALALPASGDTAIFDVDLTGRSDNGDGACTDGTGGADGTVTLSPQSDVRVVIEVIEGDSGDIADTVLRLQQPACATPDVACDDDSGPGLGSRLEVDLVAGLDYAVLIDHYAASTVPGVVRLHISVEGGGVDDSDGGLPVDGGGDAGDTFDLTGYALENREHDPVLQRFAFPPGTSLRPGDVLVVGRDATREELEAHYPAMPAEALYLDNAGSLSGLPIVNGGERFTLVDPQGVAVDGPAVPGITGQSYQRVLAGDAGDAGDAADAGGAGDTGEWLQLSMDLATPGHSTLTEAGATPVLSEWSDASPFALEFIEIVYAP